MGVDLASLAVSLVDSQKLQLQGAMAAPRLIDQLQIEAFVAQSWSQLVQHSLANVASGIGQNLNIAA